MPPKKNAISGKDVDKSGPSRDWSWKAERDLLVTIVAFGIANNGRVVNWDLVHEEFKARGHTNSRNACQTRWTREIGTEIRTIRRHFGADMVDETHGEDGYVIEEDTNEIAEGSQDREANISMTYPEADPLLISPFATTKGTARKTQHTVPPVMVEAYTNTSKFKSQKSGRNTNVLEVPMMATINDLLPIVDPLGKVRGFLTTQNQLPTLDVNTLQQTKITSILNKYGQQSSSISGMLIASDNEFLKSITVRSSEDVKAARVDSGSRASSTDGYNANPTRMKAHSENTRRSEEENPLGYIPVQHGVESGDAREWQSTRTVAESSRPTRDSPYVIENIDPRLLAMSGNNTQADNFDIFEYIHNGPEPSFDVFDNDFKLDSGTGVKPPDDTGNGGSTDEVDY